jgi:hypothetical protein
MEVLGIVAVCLLTAKYFTPLNPVRNWVIDKLIHLMIKPGFGWLDKIIILITCPMCQSFWAILIIMHSLPLAAIGAIMAKIIDLTIQRLDYEH